MLVVVFYDPLYFSVVCCDLSIFVVIPFSMSFFSLALSPARHDLVTEQQLVMMKQSSHNGHYFADEETLQVLPSPLG